MADLFSLERAKLWKLLAITPGHCLLIDPDIYAYDNHDVVLLTCSVWIFTISMMCKISSFTREYVIPVYCVLIAQLVVVKQEYTASKDFYQ